MPISIPIVEALEFPGLFGLPGVGGSGVVLWFGLFICVFIPGVVTWLPNLVYG